MTKNMLCIILLFLVTACGSNQENVAPTATVNYKPIYINYTSSAVKSAAEAGIPIFLTSELTSEELAVAQLGSPYHVFGMTNAGSINQEIFDGEEWDYPVTVNNNYRFMLKVAKMNGEWQAVAITAGLASWLQAEEMSHPSLDFKAKGLVRIYEHDSHIVMLNPSEQQPSFLLPPYLTDLLKYLPQHSGWVNTEPVPVLSFQEIFLMYSRHNN